MIKLDCSTFSVRFILAGIQTINSNQGYLMDSTKINSCTSQPQPCAMSLPAVMPFT